MLAYPTLRSIAASREFAEREGLEVEVILILDRPDVQTLSTVKSCSAHMGLDAKLIETDHGDQAGSRNEAIAAATGTLVALIDGDDLIAPSWIYKAARSLEAWGPRVCVHPSVCFMFEDELSTTPVAWLIQDSRDPDFNFSMLVQQNAWPACVALHRETALKHPFEFTPNSEGFAAEDLHWNLTLLAEGIHHAPVPETSYAYRIRGHRGNVRKGRPIRPVSLLRDKTAMASLGKFAPSGMIPLPPTEPTAPTAPRAPSWFSSAAREVVALARGLERRLRPGRTARRIQRRLSKSLLRQSLPPCDRVAISREAWFIADVDEFSLYEPRIATAMAHDYCMRQVSNQANLFSDLYWEVVDSLDPNRDTLLIAEGAEDVPPDWNGNTVFTSSRAPGSRGALGAKFEALGDAHFNAERLLSVIVTQLTPRKLVISGSRAGWRALLQWGLAISQETQIDVVAKVDLGEDELHLTPEEALRIHEVTAMMNKVLVASDTTASLLVEVYGLDPQLVAKI